MASTSLDLIYNDHAFYCYDAKTACERSSGMKLISRNNTFLTPVIIALHKIPAINLTEDVKEKFDKINILIRNLITKTICNETMNLHDSEFIDLLQMVLERHSKEKPILNNGKVFEVTIGIRYISNLDVELPMDAKDAILEHFLDFNVMHVFVQKYSPHNAYIVVPSNQSFTRLFEIKNGSTLKLSEDLSTKISLGFAYHKTPDFINPGNPTSIR